MDSINNIRFPTEPKEIAFAASYGVTTVALTALSYYAPITFFVASAPLALTHIFIFNRAVHTSDHTTVKAWMVTACLVGSAFITVQITYFIPFLSSSAIALKALDLSWTMIYLTLFTGSIGFGGAAVHKLYQKGLELAKTPVWEPMKAHMENREARESVTSFPDKVNFSLGVIDPALLWGPPAKTAKIKNILFNFIPEEQKEAQFHQLVADYKTVADAAPSDARALWPQILHHFNNLSTNKQIALLPQLIAINQRPMLSLETQQIFQQHVNQVKEKHGKFFLGCLQRRDALNKRIDSAPLSKADLEEISNDFNQFKLDIISHCSEVRLFCPELNTPKFNTFQTEIQTELMSGEHFMKLQRLNSQSTNEDDIDLEDQTWNFFLMEYTKLYRTEGKIFIEDLCHNLAVTEQELDGKLEELGIGTIGEFLEKVLGGDKKLLVNRNEVLTRLDDYITTKNDARGRIYTLMASKPVDNSYLLNMAGNAAYKSAMIITAIAPIIIYPGLTALGILISLTYHIPSVAQLANSAGSIPRRDNILECNNAFEYYAYVFNVATRRPFFSLLTNSPTGEMTTYASSNTLGKMRILATEFFFGLVILHARFDKEGRVDGLGGVVQGVAIGREASKLISRIWRRFSTRNV